MFARALIAALMSVTLALSSALAATVTPGLGELSVNQGQGFQLLTGPANLNPGDQLMVSPGGAATVVYGDGCSVSLQPGAVMVISSVSPCVNPYAQQEPPPQQTPDSMPWILGIVGLGIAGGVSYWIYTAVSASP